MLIRTNITVKVNKSESNIPCSHETLNLDYSSKRKRNSKKSILFGFLRWMSFLMIPLAFLYDEYIDRPKLCEQKNTFEYIVPPPPPPPPPPPTSGVGTIKLKSRKSILLKEYLFLTMVLLVRQMNNFWDKIMEVLKIHISPI